ncbi:MULTISPECIES: hypothetical protein [unclassified Bradyrhizobium]|uniref:hypothetical protein n=1 Tax=Bradyrhizobium sp. S3.9.2 TaxID=3156432 RepID=UPI003398BA63
MADTTAETTGARTTAQFVTARTARIAELLDHRAFAPEAIAGRIDCALEAPLRPAFRRPRP